MTGHEFVAVDVGASSGRVMLATVDGRDTPTVSLKEVHRFPTVAVPLPDGLHWDILGIHSEILQGLSILGRGGATPRSLGVDTWAVDYGLLDSDGGLLGLPFSYRDPRTDAAMDQLDSTMSPDEIYRRTGIAQLAFNTLPQLIAERGSARLAVAELLLTIPDLLTYWLTGDRNAEVTNASTTQLLDVQTRTWDRDLMRRFGLPERIFPPLREPGSRGGQLRSEVAAATGLSGVDLIAVGSHDTASAVVGTPAQCRDFAYISSGTWSLVGVELQKPVVTEAARTARFTNEAGVDGTTRFLRNVSGLWLLQESVRTWTAAGAVIDLWDLLRSAAECPGPVALIDVDHPDFLPPGDMPGRIAAHCRRTGQPVPDSPAAVARIILDSLALAYRQALRQAERLSGVGVGVVHVVGGGARNELLCQLTADATGLPVLAGPVEATALGNILVQARTAGLVNDLGAIRDAVHRSDPPTRYVPTPGCDAAWADAEARMSDSRRAAVV